MLSAFADGKFLEKHKHRPKHWTILIDWPVGLIVAHELIPKGSGSGHHPQIEVIIDTTEIIIYKIGVSKGETKRKHSLAE